MPAPNIFQRPGPRATAPQDPLLGFEVRRALLLHQAGKVDEAVEIYGRLLQSNPDQFECLHYLGVAHLQSGRPADALPLLQRALGVRANDPPLHANLALALTGLGRHDEALRSADRALALRPGMPEALSNKGWALRQLERLDEALACLDQALAASPKLVEAHQRRAQVLASLQRLDEAEAAFRRALELRPDDADTLGNLGALLTLMGRGAGRA